MSSHKKIKPKGKKWRRQICFFCLKPALKQGALKVMLTEEVTRHYAICQPCAQRPLEYLRAVCVAHECCEMLMLAKELGKELSDKEHHAVMDLFNRCMDIILEHGGDAMFLPKEYKVKFDELRRVKPYRDAPKEEKPHAIEAIQSSGEGVEEDRGETKPPDSPPSSPDTPG